jgi:hypothetical protein
MTSCLLADQASNTSFGVPQARGKQLRLVFSHYGHDTTTIHQKRLGPESERPQRSQRRWYRRAETASHQEPSQVPRRLLDVQDAQSESKKSNFMLQTHSCSQDSSSAVKRSHDATIASRWATNACMAWHQKGSKRSYDYNRHSSAPQDLPCEISGSSTRSSLPHILHFRLRLIALGRARFPLSHSR